MTATSYTYLRSKFWECDIVAHSAMRNLNFNYRDRGDTSKTFCNTTADHGKAGVCSKGKTTISYIFPPCQRDAINSSVILRRVEEVIRKEWWNWGTKKKKSKIIVATSN